VIALGCFLDIRIIGALIDTTGQSENDFEMLAGLFGRKQENSDVRNR
jgi:hypothetical protein